MSKISIDELAKYLGKTEELLEEINRLKKELHASETKVKDYRKEMKELQNHILNYTGAIRKQTHEIHVLYHKASTLLGNESKPDKYLHYPDAKKRIALQEALDKVEPTEISFKSTAKKWTLTEYGSRPWVNPVNSYPEQALAFC
jgi:uncharacterized coiled-coil DUF342 family protein